MSAGHGATVHVAVGIVIAETGAVLIARRPDHVHQGGLWEFPGGKVEAGETVIAALKRELSEELGITVQTAEPLLQIRHPYPDKNVFLDVWRITRYQGNPHGQEGQPLRWVLPTELNQLTFPAADGPIIAALRRNWDQMAQQASSKGISDVL